MAIKDAETDGLVSLDAVIADLEVGKEKGKKETVEDDRPKESTELTPEEKRKEQFGLTAFIIAHYWEEMEKGIQQSLAELNYGASFEGIMNSLLKNCIETIDAKLKANLYNIQPEHLADAMEIKVMARFAKVRDRSDVERTEAVRQATEHVLEGMLQGAASILAFADGIIGAFRAQYGDKLSKDEIEDNLKRIFQGKDFQKIIARMGYGSGNAMGAIFSGILEEGRKFNVEFEGPRSKAKIGARFSQNIFDEGKIFFKEEDGQIKLYVSPQTKRDIESRYSEFSSGSKDNLVWVVLQLLPKPGRVRLFYRISVN